MAKKYQLADFNSISAFAKHLRYCQEHSLGHRLDYDNPEKEVIDWMMALITNDHRLIYFDDSIEVLYLLKDIAQTQKKIYRKFEKDLIAVISLYYKKISKYLNVKNNKNQSSLDSFFIQFDRNKRIRNIKNTDESKLKDLVRKIDRQYAKHQRVQIQLDKHKSQLAYSQLLEDILLGTKSKSLLLAGAKQANYSPSTESLLPDNEYDVPSAEPEHPDRIGINRTMSFNKSSQTSVLALFNTDELKMEFLAAFPWAAQFDTIDKLHERQFDDHVNLLGTPRLFSNELQLAIMKFVLLAMDAIGKIAGFSGELTIQNFDRINVIVNQLKWISAAMQHPDSNEQALLVEVTAAVQEISFRNNEYFEMQQMYNPPIVVESNPNMNGFCHINEHLVYQLTGINYDGSLLAPSSPSSPYLEKIAQVLDDR